ncbi:MAG: right-handed parallel beta-helix repeat-containing protein [Phycisphaerales bacterium]
MKRSKTVLQIVVPLVLAATCHAMVMAAETVTIRPEETDELLANPGMGWETFHRTRDKDRNLPDWLPSTVHYARWGWGVLEPRPGEIDYAFLDKTLAETHAAGQKLAFRVMCCSTTAGQPYQPGWLVEAGCKVLTVDYSGQEGLTIPDLDDPTTLARHLHFIRRLGERYDGHPDLDHVDLGAVGWWGEWHMSSSKTARMPTPENRKLIIDTYLEAFRKTPLLMLVGDPECLAYAAQRGAGWRADCLGDMGGFSKGWYHMRDAYPKLIQEAGVQDAWKKAPIAWESCWEMRKWVQEDWSLRYIFNYALALHGSYLNNKSAPLPVAQEVRPEIERFLRRLGYRLVLRELTHPKQAVAGTTLPIEAKWQNIGSAPCYRPYRVAYRLASDNGDARVLIGSVTVEKWMPGSVELFTEEFMKQPPDLPPGEIVGVTDSVALPSDLPAGQYVLAVGIVGENSMEPVVRLAIQGRSSDGWYPLSKVTIARGRDYHVSPTGDDSNPGTSEKPWRSIEKVNAARFEPGDSIRFLGGRRFAGTIVLSHADAVTVTSYDDGPAVIDGANGSGLTAVACDNLTVKSLVFTGSGRKAGNTADGVVVTDANGLQIDHVEVSGFRGAGLQLDGIRDARITRVHAHDNGFAGISVGYHQRSSRVRIDHCVAENNPGDPSNLTNPSGTGIVVAATDDATIEYCEAFSNGWDMPRKGNGPVGIWVWDVDRAVIQSCVSHDNKSPGDDGGGFDLDGGATNSVLQYNLSYNNDGPGYFLCQFPGAGDFKNNIVRYNISHNDGVKNNRRSGIDVFSASPNASDCQVYNNTIYNHRGPAVGFGGMPMPNVLFRNNIFICSGDVIGGGSQRGRFENNIYWSADGRPLSFDGHATAQEWAEATGQERAGETVLCKYLDPKVNGVNEVNDVTTLSDPAKLPALTAYRVQPSSPCLKAGMPVKGNGGRDFWGNPVPQDDRPTIGACEKP